MDLATAIRAVIATMRTRPADLLPFYILGLAVPGIVRVISVFGVIGIIAYLVVSGRFDVILAEFEGIYTPPPDPETDTDAYFEWLESFTPVLELLVTPTTVLVLVVTVLVTLVGIVILNAVVSAGQLAACHARLQQRRGLRNGIAGVRVYWRRFVGLVVLEIVLWVLVVGLVIGVIATAALVSVVLGIFVAIFALLFAVSVLVAIRAIFAFAPVAIVVDDVSVFDSLRASVGFIRAEVMNAVSYYVISVGLLIGYGGLTSTLGAIGAPRIAAIGSFLLIAPFLDLLKTGLFGAYRDSIDPFEAHPMAPMSQFRGGMRRGLSEMSGFVRESPGLHLLSTGALSGGFAMGWAAAEPFDGTVDAAISARLVGHIPPVQAVDLFGNNWTVALSMGFSGVAAGVPTAVGLWFNGVVFGAAFRLERAIDELVAFVIPHGVLEIPAIVVAGAVGFQLGIVTWRTWRGRATRLALADALERAFWVLVGVGVVLAVAAGIEAFVSPYYWRLFL